MYVDITVADGNAFYDGKNNCLVDKKNKTLISGCSASVIPDDGSVKSIADQAFYGIDKLDSVVIPDGVTEIWQYTFGNCSALTSVTIGSGVVRIIGAAFYRCDNLQSAIFKNADGWQVMKESSDEDVIDLVLTDAEESATYLKSYTAYLWVWERKTN